MRLEGGDATRGGARRRHRRRLVVLFLGAIALLSFPLSVGLALTPDPLRGENWSSVIVDRNGELLGASIASDGQWRFPPSGAVEPRYVEALLCFEDGRFRLHPGVDPFSVLRAAYQWLSRGKVVSGASTVTMQTVRLLRAEGRAGVAGARGLGDKALEALLALRLEASFSKDRILRIYASVAPYGGNVVGLEAASWRWFGRGATELTWAEAAALAVLPNNPALVNPGSGRDELLDKRNGLLARLRATGRLGEGELAFAIAEPLPPEPFPLPRLAPQLLDRARETQGDALSRPAGGGARDGTTEAPAPADSALVHTSVDRGLQIQVQAIVDRNVAHFAGNGVRNAACIVLDVATGEALAYVGNATGPQTASSSPFVDMAVARRSSGSILKPFLYAAMLEAGELLPDRLVFDVPTSIGGYLPENNVRRFEGAVPAKEALARSLNIPAVLELRAFGVDRFVSILRGLGISTLFRRASDYGLPLILGGGEVTLWEMTGLYAGLARTALSAPGSERDRAFFPPSWSPRLSEGGRYTQAAGRFDNPYSAASAYLTLEALLDVARPGEEAAWQDYASGKRIAWKTGTSFGFRDAWAIGVTSRFAVGVWVGNASGEGRAELRGILNAAPILFEVFSSLPSAPWFPQPSAELVHATVCAQSGYLAGPYCANTVDRLVPKAGATSAVCPFCRAVSLDESGKFQVTIGELPSTMVRTENRFVLPPTPEWFYRMQHYDYRPLPPFRSRDGVVPSSRAFGIIQPREGSLLYVPIELSGAEGKLVFEAAATDPGATLYWHLDQAYLGSTRGRHRLEIRPAAGHHALTVVDEWGGSETVHFEVLSK